MKETYLSECLEQFHSLPEPIQDMIGGFDACLEIKALEEIYGVSLSFAVILLAIGELNLSDVADYLYLKFGFDKNKGEEVADKLEEKIFTPVLNAIIEVNRGDELKQSGLISDLPLAEKKEFILKTFTEQLVPAITAEPAKIKDFNVAIFQALNEDETLTDRIESLLYINQEKISNHLIILDGHPASPSIANWLKDFIKKYGSDIFNEVTLAEYLSQSPNIKLIKPEEKELVRKVLKIYRNLVFFPESMEGVALESWEIFPVGHSEIKTETETENVSENPVITERQKTIFDLQKNLTKYSSTSLEYKAIHQEINRLSRK
jgi:hypothetical protein